jgi:hypothetical protein
MNDVFISYAEEDAAIADAIADALASRGIGAWYYQRDSLPGVSYLLQIGRAIDECEVIVLLISVDSMASHQVTKEVIRGHESEKAFVPVLLGVTHTQFQAQPEWREAIGAAASIPISPSDVAASLPRLLAGIDALLGGPGGFTRPTPPLQATQPTVKLVVADAPKRHELNQPFGEESCEYEVALLREDYPAFYFEETPFNLDAIDPDTYLIVGRRGCGKSSLAHYFAFQTRLQNARCIDVNEAHQHELLLKIAERVYYSTSMATPALVDIWAVLVWSLIFNATGDAVCQRGADAANQVLRATLSEDSGHSELIKQFLNSPTFDNAQTRTLTTTSQVPVIVAVDTLEKYDRTNEPLMALTAALVECASNFNILYAARGVHVKAFLSAEVFPHIKESAVSNTSKFIRNELYLTWRPRDLMRLVCWRLDSYLAHRKMLPAPYDKDIDWRNFDEVHAHRWVPYFGETLTNEFGRHERAFPYVLRHIQMRPRQLVILCNQIARLAIRSGRFPRMDGQLVVKAISDGQRRLADEVLNLTRRSTRTSR